MIAAPGIRGVAFVTAQSALTVPDVNLAVMRISSALGTMPAKLYRRTDGGKEVATDHPAYRLIHRRASSLVRAGALRRQLTQDALLHGNGYAIANRVNGSVLEFLRVDPTAMAVEANEFGEPFYRLTTKNGIRAYEARDVLHLPALLFDHDGLRGLSPIKLAREAISLSLTMEKHGANLFQNGARPSLGVTYPADATAPSGPDRDGSTARKNLVTATRAGLEGVENSGKAAIFFDGATVTPFTFSSVDAQFLELRRFAVDEIARAFGIPPHLLFELGRATWGNSEEMARQFRELTLLPWIEAWQDAYERVLLDPETDEDLSVEFVADDLPRADTSTRFEAYSKAIASRILNPNEVRAMENRAPYEGGEAFLNPNTTTGAAPAKEAV